MSEWKQFYEEDFEDEHRGETYRMKVVVATEGVLFYTWQRPDGWTLGSPITHYDFRVNHGYLRDHPEIYARVSAYSRAVASGGPMPGEEADEASLLSRLSAGISSLFDSGDESEQVRAPAEASQVPGSYRDAARPKAKAAPKHDPAIDRWDVERISRHVERGWALDRLDVTGESALTTAIDARDEALVDRLIIAGANVHHPADSPPLLMACRRGNLHMIGALLDAGADPNAVDSTGQGALQRLLALGMPNDVEATVARLLAAGADPNGRSADHRSPLGCAALYSSPAVCTLLLHAGAEPETTGYFGTALMQAGRADVIQVLLAHGADLEALDEQGRTALWYAAKEGSVEAVQMMLEAGLDPGHADHEGVTPRDVARCRVHARADVMTLLERAVSGDPTSR